MVAQADRMEVWAIGGQGESPGKGVEYRLCAGKRILAREIVTKGWV
jgi:hypothetical protein